MFCGVDYPVKPDNDRERECGVMTGEGRSAGGVVSFSIIVRLASFNVLVRLDSFVVIARLDRAIGIRSFRVNKLPREGVVIP